MRRSFLLLALVAAGACGDDKAPSAPAADAGVPPVCEGAGLSVVCEAAVAHTCDGDDVSESEDCAERGLVCAANLGCRACVPNEVGCEGNTTRICAPDGSGWSAGEACDLAEGERCSPHGCAKLCEEATAARSYLGCEYWPVVTSNVELDDEFEFAIVVANPQLVQVQVEVTGPGITPIVRNVEAGGVAAISLPWVAALKGALVEPASALVRGGAYRVVSEAPVVVYQFNPLEYEIDRDCPDETSGNPADDRCNSYTNDASLLLPTHALTGSYVVISRGTLRIEFDGSVSSAPGFAAIVGTADDTDVEVTSSANVLPSVDGTIAALATGESRTFRLDAGDVLQLLSATPATCEGTSTTESVEGVTLTYCDVTPAWDLTGTVVRASAPVAVVSGHDCAFVPAHRFACDHLEEQMIPVEAWGRDIVVSPTQPLRGEPQVVRIVSARAGNALRFDPPEQAPVTLGALEHVEFEARADVRITGTEPFAVAQFMVGQDYGGPGSSGAYGAGDPSMGLAIPAEQWRDEYAFLAPATYDQSWITVIAPASSRIVLDEHLVFGRREVGGTGLVTARTRVGGGAHRIRGTGPFGILVYGFGAYTSYLVPGGLDLRVISPPI